MKSFRILLSVATLLISCTMAFAQHEAQKPVTQSDAQKSFDQLKTLAGTWEGHGTTSPAVPDMPDTMQVNLSVASSGNVLMHEMMGKAKTDNPKKDADHPVTMLYLDGDRLLLTHYCDAGNRPRMAARVSPDGKKIEFDFVDVSGSTKHGHMDHAVFTIIDANHHTEDWTYLMPGDKPMHAHIDLQRVNQQTASAR